MLEPIKARLASSCSKNGADADADQEDEDNRHNEPGAVGAVDLVGLAHLS